MTIIVERTENIKTTQPSVKCDAKVLFPYFQGVVT